MVKLFFYFIYIEIGISILSGCASIETPKPNKPVINEEIKCTHKIVENSGGSGTLEMIDCSPPKPKL
jgi:hypothetical protein